MIIDVGSSSVGACFLERQPGHKPVLSFVKRVPIGKGTEETRENIAQLAVGSLTTLLKDYEQQARPGAVRMVLASPWYASRIKFVTSKAEKPVKISRASIVNTVREYRTKEGAAEAALSGTPMESMVTQVYVNGYPTALKHSVFGTTLRLHLYESAADAAFLERARAAVLKVFPSVKLTFHSFPLLAFIVLRDIRDEENFTFVDAGGEVTDVAVVHRDSLRFLGTFPKGSLFLVRAVASGKSNADSASRLSLYARDELSPQEEAVFKKSFDDAIAPWVKDYVDTIAVAQTDTAIPQTTFIAADVEELRWFGRVIESVRGVFPARPILMSPDFFQAHIALGESASYDAFLSVGALFAYEKGEALLQA